MRFVIQRVKHSSVTIDGEVKGKSIKDIWFLSASVRTITK